jgi:hypothetical protein
VDPTVSDLILTIESESDEAQRNHAILRVAMLLEYYNRPMAMDDPDFYRDLLGSDLMELSWTDETDAEVVGALGRLVAGVARDEETTVGGLSALASARPSSGIPMIVDLIQRRWDSWTVAARRQAIVALQHLLDHSHWATEHYEQARRLRELVSELTQGADERIVVPAHSVLQKLAGPES